MRTLKSMAGMLAGFELVGSSVMTITKEVHRRERKWARRVMYQRDRRFAFTYAQFPSTEIIRMGNKIVAHPATIERIKLAIEQAKP